MTEIKSVNIASWGLAITALFILMIGIEEVLCATHILDKWGLASGNFFAIVGLLTFVIALYCFWNSNKIYGIVFLWLFIFFTIIPFTGSYGLDITLLGQEGGDNVRALFTLGSHTMIVGIVIGVFTAFMAIWAFMKVEGEHGKFLGVFLVGMAVFALFQAIGAGFWVNDIEVFSSFPFVRPFSECSNEGAANAMFAVAGVGAIVAGLIGIYAGFVREKFLDKPLNNEPESAAIGSVDITVPGMLTVAFFLVTIGIYMIISPDFGTGIKAIVESHEGEYVHFFANDVVGAYWLPPMVFAIPGLGISLLLTLFAYWGGSKKAVTGFLIAVVVFIMMTICMVGTEIIGGFIQNGMPIVWYPEPVTIELGNKLNVVPYILSALFIIGVAAWVGVKSGMHKLYAVSLGLIGLAFIVLALTCTIGTTELSWGPNYGTLSAYKTFDLIAGIVILVSGLILTYCGIAKTKIANLPMW